MKRSLILSLSLLGSLLLIITNYFGTYRLCAIGNGENTIFNLFFSKLLGVSCISSLATAVIILIIFLPIFLFSLITYKMSDAVFQSWRKFVYWWVPLTIILTILAPEYSQSLLPITKGVVSLGMSILFMIISLLVIVTKHFSTKK